MSSFEKLKDKTELWKQDQLITCDPDRMVEELNAIYPDSGLLIEANRHLAINEIAEIADDLFAEGFTDLAINLVHIFNDFCIKPTGDLYSGIQLYLRIADYGLRKGSPDMAESFFLAAVNNAIQTGDRNTIIEIAQKFNQMIDNEQLPDRNIRFPDLSA